MAKLLPCTGFTNRFVVGRAKRLRLFQKYACIVSFGRRNRSTQNTKPKLFESLVVRFRFHE